ncbi:tetratricopeptide repeat protein [Chryseobacterium scophthalmum]|uniref:tetratricopeptide repeat protein n=1 Tax=Chryseobacterium scophthalmum TaxID=59733 RepID=UPI003D04C295
MEKDSETLRGEELYYLGYAFFSKENDLKAIEYYDKALAKKFDNPILYFQKGYSQMFLKQYDKALENINIAISKAPLAEFYVEKARIYLIKKDIDNEEKTYIEGLQQSKLKNDKWFLELVKNAGNFYYAQVKNFPKSEKIYIDAIIEYPNEYVLYEKLIKVLNTQNKFVEANKVFDQVKVFYSEKKLSEDNMKFKNFAVDEFQWNDQWINVYKSFEKPKEMLESIYKVYLINKAGEKIERKFNIEKTLQINKADAEFVICEESNGGHTTYPIGFKDDSFTLEDLRIQIRKILDKSQK